MSTIKLSLHADLFNVDIWVWYFSPARVFTADCKYVCCQMRTAMAFNDSFNPHLTYFIQRVGNLYLRCLPSPTTFYLFTSKFSPDMISSNIRNFIRKGKDFYCRSKALTDNCMFNDFLQFQTKQQYSPVCMSGCAVLCQPYVIKLRVKIGS